MTQQYGDLANAIVHEPSEEWPTMIELVAYWGDGRRKRRSIEIPAAAFFGHGHGAPMSGDQIIGMIQRLRRQGPKRD